MELVIRRATTSDVAAVLALWRAADAVPSRTDDVHSVTRLVEADPGALIVADAAGAVVGSVIAAFDGWRGSVYRLAVAPDARRRGLGRRLVRAAEERLEQAGALRVQAIVVEDDAPAVAFWQASGWALQSERLRFVRG